MYLNKLFCAEDVILMTTLQHKALALHIFQANTTLSISLAFNFCSSLFVYGFPADNTALRTFLQIKVSIKSFF
jgi:hypothetical protein